MPNGALHMLEVWDLSHVWNQFIVLGENKSDLADVVCVLLMAETLDYLELKIPAGVNLTDEKRPSFHSIIKIWRHGWCYMNKIQQ